MAKKISQYKIISASKFLALVKRTRGKVSGRSYAQELGVSSQYLSAVELGLVPASAKLAANFRQGNFVCQPVMAYELVPYRTWLKTQALNEQEQAAKKEEAAKEKKRERARAARLKKKRAAKRAAKLKLLAKKDPRQMEMVIPMEPVPPMVHTRTAEAQQKEFVEKTHKRTPEQRKKLNGNRRTPEELERLKAQTHALRAQEPPVSFGAISKLLGVPKASVIGWSQQGAA